MSGSYFLGNDFKLLIEMEAPGFSMVDHDWEVTLKSGSKVLATYAKADCIKDDQDNYYALVRGEVLRAGNIDIVFHAMVPDEDWDDGIMNEVDKQVLFNLKKS